MIWRNCGVPRNPKIKPHTDALRLKLRDLPVMGGLAIRPGEFQPSIWWFSHASRRAAIKVVVRRHAGSTYVFRIA